MLDALAGRPVAAPADPPRAPRREGWRDWRRRPAAPSPAEDEDEDSDPALVPTRLRLHLADAAALVRAGGGAWLRARLAEEREAMNQDPPRDALDDLQQALSYRKPRPTPASAQTFTEQLKQFIETTNQAEADLGPGGAQAAAAIYRAKNQPT